MGKNRQKDEIKQFEEKLITAELVFLGLVILMISISYLLSHYLFYGSLFLTYQMLGIIVLASPCILWSRWSLKGILICAFNTLVLFLLWLFLF